MPSERSARRSWVGRGGGIAVYAATAGYVAFAPIGLLALPLAGLLLTSRPRTARELAAAALALAASIWWIVPSGPPPDQVTRAAAVVGAATFVLATWYSRSTVVHRALLAVTTTAAAITALFVLGSWSWDEVRWWVAVRTGFAVRVILGPLASKSVPGGSPSIAELERWFESGTAFLADQYGAILAIQLLAGLGLAAVLYYRISTHPVGRRPGRFRDFRFSEHLGWAAAAALAVVLIPRLAVAKDAAVNLLLVAGVLYALRGVAVTAFGLALVGGAGIATLALFGVLALFILPAVLAGAIVLGVVDAGMDLRRRWATPPAKD